MYHRRRDSRGAPQRYHHAVHAHRLGSAQQRAQVLWILDHIQQQHEERFLGFSGAFQDVSQRGIRIGAGFEGHALRLRAGLAQVVNLSARHALHLQFTAGRQPEDFGQPAFFLHAGRHPQAEDVPAARSQLFIHWISPGDPFLHARSLWP
jgi:hypothetical protein